MGLLRELCKSVMGRLRLFLLLSQVSWVTAQSRINACNSVMLGLINFLCKIN